MTWASGPRVEGYTNLLWVLGVALLGKIGFELILAARILGVLCCGLTAWALLQLPVLGEKNAQITGKLLGIALFAMSATTGIWAIGGLEQPMVGAGLAGGLLGTILMVQTEGSSVRGGWIAGVSLALMCLTRPDSPLFVVILAGCYLLERYLEKKTVDRRAVFLLVGLPVLAYIGQLIFRQIYYGDWVPNTAHVKLAPSPIHMQGGLEYVASGFKAGWPLYVTSFACLVQLLRQRQTGAFLILFFIPPAWMAYLILIGGDIFPGFRHFTPLVVTATFTVAMGFGGLLQSIKQEGAGVLVALCVGSLSWIVQIFSPDVQRGVFENFEWSGRDLALTLKRAFGRTNPIMAVTAAGCLPYWSEFDSIDMLGLNDYFLPKHPPKNMGTGLIGHELGSGEYIMRRRPDLIVYNLGTMSGFTTGAELSGNPEFLASYTPVNLRVTAQPDAAGYGWKGKEWQFDAIVWMDRYSPRLGFTKTARSLVVPGYLVNGNPSSQVVADSDGVLETKVALPLPARVTLPRRDLPPSPFKVTFRGEGKAITTWSALPNGDLQVEIKVQGRDEYSCEALRSKVWAGESFA